MMEERTTTRRGFLFGVLAAVAGVATGVVGLKRAQDPKVPSGWEDANWRKYIVRVNYTQSPEPVEWIALTPEKGE